MDRLPDSMLTDSEIAEFNKDVIKPPQSWDQQPEEKMIAMFALYKDGKFTGKMLIIPTDDQFDTMSVLQQEWINTGLTVQMGETGKMTYGWAAKMNALQIVLQRYKYTPKFTDVLGLDCLYDYEYWMENLL